MVDVLVRPAARRRRACLRARLLTVEVLEENDAPVRMLGVGPVRPSAAAVPSGAVVRCDEAVARGRRWRRQREPLAALHVRVAVAVRRSSLVEARRARRGAAVRRDHVAERILPGVACTAAAAGDALLAAEAACADGAARAGRRQRRWCRRWRRRSAEPHAVRTAVTQIAAVLLRRARAATVVAAAATIASVVTAEADEPLRSARRARVCSRRHLPPRRPRWSRRGERRRRGRVAHPLARVGALGERRWRGRRRELGWTGQWWEWLRWRRRRQRRLRRQRQIAVWRAGGAWVGHPSGETAFEVAAIRGGAAQIEQAHAGRVRCALARISTVGERHSSGKKISEQARLCERWACTRDGVHLGHTRSLTEPLPVTPVSAHAPLCTPQRLVGW